MSKPILLVLGRGYLGGRISQFFREGSQYQVVSDPVDVTHPEALEALMEKLRPAIVVNAAGKTKTGEIERGENRAEALRVNVDGPATLAYLSRSFGYRLVHIGTGMIFDGVGPEGTGWVESAVPNPTSFYAWTKAWADALLAPFAERDRILILRIHLPLSRIGHPRNLLTKLQRFDQVSAVPCTLTVIEDFLVALDQLLQKEVSGIYHVVNPGTINLAEIVAMMKEGGLMPREKEVRSLSQAELDALTAASGGAQQPHPVLSTAKLQAAGVQLPPVQEAVREAIAAFVPEL